MDIPHRLDAQIPYEAQFVQADPGWVLSAAQFDDRSDAYADVEAPALARRGRQPGLNQGALKRAYAYIETHLGDSFTLSDLAAAACVSRFHFARLFRLSTGKSPMEFVLGMRIARAKAILIQHQQTISATAATLGFCDQSHFTRTFRRFTGTSPKRFAVLHTREQAHG